MRLDRALDRFDGDMARRNCSRRSRDDYFWHLRRLFDHLPPEDPETGDLTQVVIRDCLDEWADATPSTRYKVDAIFRSFCKWLYFNDLVERNPMDKLPRPKRTHPDDIPLRSLSGSDVRKPFERARPGGSSSACRPSLTSALAAVPCPGFAAGISTSSADGSGSPRRARR